MTRLVPMSEADFLEFTDKAIPIYAAEKTATGEWASEESIELSKKAFDELLPAGLSTPDNYLYLICDSQTQVKVGVLWFASISRGGSQIAYVYVIEIDPEHQRKGHATRAFEALEAEARALGLAGVALHVFGHNIVAQSLYSKIGFQTTDLNMFKPIETGVEKKIEKKAEPTL